MDTKELLKRLISYATISSESNLELIRFIQDLLSSNNIESQLVYNQDQTKAAMLATIGPKDKAGILFSGHSDVVPVKGQNWNSDPFNAVEKEGKIFGRGACDMKGFIASAINVLLEFSDKELSRPIHLAISFDEELGCLGVKDLLMQLQQLNIEPYLCIVGEPTNMNIATGHKGKTAYRAHCCGDEGHSSLAPLHTNAIYLACDVISHLRSIQADLIANGAHDDEFDVPYSTVHIGTINGGRSLNIVPGQCEFEFEIRHLPEDDIESHLDALFKQAEDLVNTAKQIKPQSNASINFECLTNYPGLDTDKNHSSVQTLASLAPENTQVLKVAFGTEGGLFSQYLSSPVVICGPGSIEQAHKPDEFVTLAQLEQCDQLLNKFVLETCIQRSEHD